MTTPNLPEEIIKGYIENGQAKTTTWLPMPWNEMSSQQKDIANWYVKHKGSYSSRLQVAWHIIALQYIANNNEISVKEADLILLYWTKEGDPCNPEPIGMQMYHG